MKKILLAILLSMAMTSCAASGITKISDNEMYITEASNWGISHGTLRLNALKKAKESCGQKDVKILSDEMGGVTGWSATTVNIRFRCE